MDKVIILTTGGTIEKIYDERDGSLVNQGSIIKQHLLDHLRVKHTALEVVSLMSKDSLDMSDEDRKSILDSLKSYVSMGLPIIILHGTDTMEQTARYCWKNLKNLKVPIVFTGAMKPLGFVDSDAGQNFIEALTAAKLCKPGFYITFHSGIFEVPHVTKNKELGTFVIKPDLT